MTDPNGQEDEAKKPRQPHDLLVKQIFGDPKHARIELEAVLPPAVVAALDWSTLEVLPETFIDPAFAKTQADLLFRIQLAGHEARIYVVFEHKSDAKAETLVQVGGYVVDVLERYFRRGGKLPAPVSQVLQRIGRWTGRRASISIDPDVIPSQCASTCRTSG
ncbi:MAG: Rpn family recombination-promoting nuclease/putative transposase [Polyangiaceae bacterium]